MSDDLRQAMAGLRVAYAELERSSEDLYGLDRLRHVSNQLAERYLAPGRPMLTLIQGGAEEVDDAS